MHSKSASHGFGRQSFRPDEFRRRTFKDERAAFWACIWSQFEDVVRLGDKIEIVYAVYKSEDEANAVLAKLSDKSLYIKKYDIAKGSFKWCKDDMKSAVESALGYFHIAFDKMFECSDSLNAGSIGIDDAKTEIKVLYTQIEDIKSAFYQNVANSNDERITQIKLGLVTTLALLDNIDFSKSAASVTSSIRYQLVQLVLCRQALMNNL